MKNFKFSYDEASDDLFIYLEGKKSAGAVEIGDFVFDFDEQENLVALQILNASEVLSRLMYRVISLKNIKGIRAEVIKFRNMNAIDIRVQLADRKEHVPIVIPRITRSSPVLEV